ncbi:MAG: hypothetical protein Aureis2KO_20180 [Aureisphaera sp.]
MKKKPILVTGAHRSGSTWVGKILSASPKMRYVHEPFNPQRQYPVPPIKTWFLHLGKFTREKEQADIRKYLKAFLDTSIGSIRATMAPSKRRLSLLRELRSRWLRRTVFKDPIALLSAEWMYDNMNCDVVIVVRHPAAFVASLKVKDWQFNFHNFLRQEQLMNGYLKEYANEIKAYSENNEDIIKQGVLLWNCLYSTVKAYQSKYGNSWYFVTHEALSEQPIEEFKSMYGFLEIPWSQEVANEIGKTTQGLHSDGNHLRDSKKNIHTWKERLSTDEVQKIKDGTREVWEHFYSESDW